MDDEILRITPGVGSGAYEVILTNRDILSLVWQSGFPILARRYQTGGYWDTWLDRSWQELGSLHEIVVGQPIIIDDARGPYTSPNVLIIHETSDDDDDDE